MEHTDHLAAHEAEHLRTLTAAEAEGDERAVEAALRPRTLAEVVGQHRVREQLGLVLEAAASPTTCCCPARPASARPRWR
jgi:Holliday junction DNA helicase RuvB